MELILLLLGYIGIGAVTVFLLSLFFSDEIKDSDAMAYSALWPIFLLIGIPVFLIMIVLVVSMRAGKFIRRKM